jgi:hypothetical protein
MDDRSALPLVHIAVTVYDTIIARCYVILGTGASAHQRSEAARGTQHCATTVT